MSEERQPISDLERAMVHDSIARMRAGVMAVVFGMTCAAGFFIATAWLLIRGGPNVGRTLGLLRNYFPGYSVTWSGSLVGLAYGAVVGAVAGYTLARVYNRLARAPTIDDTSARSRSSRSSPNP